MVLEAKRDVGGWICERLDQEFPRVASRLGYAELMLATQSVKWRQGVNPEIAKFPALRVNVAYALRGTGRAKAFQRNRAADVIGIDISFNESLGHIQVLELTDGRALFAYGLADLIAEKYRAVLRQVPRDRYRRQDVFDLDLLITGNETDDEPRAQILDALVRKCHSRHLKPSRTSLDAPEVKERSGVQWNTLALEVGEPPDFEACFTRVSGFYRNLPWSGRARASVQA